jgi:uncharacterized protein (TIGR02596 family)
MHLPASRFSPGFTLVELLVVLAITAILATLAIPSISGMMRSYQLESTSQMVVNQLTLARQTAQTKGYAVQVRIYQLPDYNQAPNSAPSVYRGMQAFVESSPSATSTVTITPITRPSFFQSGTILLGDSTKSTLLTLTATTPTTTDPLLPVYQSNYKYIVFRFLPTGQTDLANTQNCLTVVMEYAGLTASGLPANFQTIQIDSINGAIRSFRP